MSPPATCASSTGATSSTCSIPGVGGPRDPGRSHHPAGRVRVRVLAMALPIGTALAGLLSGMALVARAFDVATMPDFTTAMAAMIGLGVGIDYALVHRHRCSMNSA